MLTQFGALAFAMAAGITVLPHAAVAAEIKIMCPAPMRTAIVDLAARFERKTPHKITFIHLPSSFIVDRVKGGEAVDVTILTARASDDLIKEGKLARRVDIARSSIGIAVRAGAPKPDVSSAEAFKRTLLAVKSFARNYIELDPEELEAVAIESKRTIDIDEFVPKDEIDELYLNNPYYIAPDGEVGQQAFAVIREAIRKEGMVAIGKSCSRRASTSLPLKPAARDCSASRCDILMRYGRKPIISTTFPMRRSPRICSSSARIS